jgi:glycosyltransferase involved in cell wall biosynthesis
MKSNFPFFSIIIPVYNRLELLKTALKSINNQNFKSYEIIVIDDGSTDDLFESLHIADFDNLVLIKNFKNKGASGARNSGIEIAQGQWIAFLDSDDWWHENKLSILHNYITNYPSFGVFYSGAFSVERNSNVTPILAKEIIGDISNFLGRTNPIRAFSSLVVKKIYLNQAGNFDELLPARQDIDLYYRLSSLYHFYYVPYSLVYIGIHAKDRISHNYKNRLMGWLLVYRKHRLKMSFSDRIYQQKRIAYFSWKVKFYKIFIMYLPGAILSTIENQFVRLLTNKK